MFKLIYFLENEPKMPSGHKGERLKSTLLSGKPAAPWWLGNKACTYNMSQFKQSKTCLLIINYILQPEMSRQLDQIDQLIENLVTESPILDFSFLSSSAWKKTHANDNVNVPFNFLLIRVLLSTSVSVYLSNNWLTFECFIQNKQPPLHLHYPLLPWHWHLFMPK